MSLGTVIVRPRPTTKEPGSLTVKDVGVNAYGVKAGDTMYFPDPGPDLAVTEGGTVSFTFDSKTNCKIVKVFAPGEI